MHKTYSTVPQVYTEQCVQFLNCNELTIMLISLLLSSRYKNYSYQGHCSPDRVLKGLGTVKITTYCLHASVICTTIILISELAECLPCCSGAVSRYIFAKGLETQQSSQEDN